MEVAHVSTFHHLCKKDYEWEDLSKERLGVISRHESHLSLLGLIERGCTIYLPTIYAPTYQPTYVGTRICIESYLWECRLADRNKWIAFKLEREVEKELCVRECGMCLWNTRKGWKENIFFAWIIFNELPSTYLSLQAHSPTLTLTKRSQCIKGFLLCPCKWLHEV